MTLTVTFRLGTDPDKAQQLVQNRVHAGRAAPARARCAQLGITTIKSSPDLTMVVHLLSPNGRYDMTYLRNYAVLNVKDRLARIDGVGEVQLFGSGDYSMRVWLDPQKVAERGLTAGDVVDAIRGAERRRRRPAWSAARPSVHGLDLQLSVNAQGRLQTEEEFGDIIVKTGADGEVTRLRDVARDRARRLRIRAALAARQQAGGRDPDLPGAGLQRDRRSPTTSARRWPSSRQNMPEGVDYSIVYDPTQFVRASIEAVVHTLLEAVALVVLVVILFLQTWRASIIPLHRGAGVDRRHVRGDACCSASRSTR